MTECANDPPDELSQQIVLLISKALGGTCPQKFVSLAGRGTVGEMIGNWNFIRESLWWGTIGFRPAFLEFSTMKRQPRRRYKLVVPHVRLNTAPLDKEIVCVDTIPHSFTLNSFRDRHLMSADKLEAVEALEVESRILALT